jgi:hypothetical protein
MTGIPDRKQQETEAQKPSGTPVTVRIIAGTF